MDSRVTGVRGCDLGYEEHDGFRYCFVHFDFRPPGSSHSWCDRAPSLPVMMPDETRHEMRTEFMHHRPIGDA
jgi:hypothetical protein